MTGPLRSQVFVIDDLHGAIEFCYDQGWTDGLPVVPPTVEKVQEFLDVAGRRPDEVVFDYLERSRVVTVEKVAINAVMAGCRPEYFPVVLALIEAIATPEFGIHPLNASTGGSALGFVVNGPIRQQIGMNCQGNVLGPGNRANSTIGRAVRLTQINALGSTPGAGNDLAADGGPPRPVLDRSTIGQPAKYAGYHLAEYEEAFPVLEPLHVTLGFEPTQNVGTVFTAVGHLAISTHAERTAEQIIETYCYYLVGSGRLQRSGSCVMVIPPETAEVFVRDGWTKADIGQAVHQGTTRSAAWVKRAGGSISAGLMDPPRGEVQAGDESATVAVAGSGADVHVVVAGGPAGAFTYALLPYGPGFVAREIHPAEPARTQER